MQQPADVEAVLRLPDFSNSTYPTADLISNISQLSRIHLPSWHQGATISMDVLFSIYMIVCKWEARGSWLFSAGSLPRARLTFPSRLRSHYSPLASESPLNRE